MKEKFFQPENFLLKRQAMTSNIQSSYCHSQKFFQIRLIQDQSVGDSLLCRHFLSMPHPLRINSSNDGGKEIKTRNIEDFKILKSFTLAPIWLPHWPACIWTISLILLFFQKWQIYFSLVFKDGKSFRFPLKTLTVLSRTARQRFLTENENATRHGGPFSLSPAI